MTNREFIDTFPDSRPAGHVVGRSTENGLSREGVDREGIIGIDHGALRIAPLIEPGWGRAGLAYGPYRRESGLAFGALVLNGHNASETVSLGVPLFRRLGRWALGPGSESLLRRLISFARQGRWRLFGRQLRHWILLNRRYRSEDAPHPASLRENLAAGWFTGPAPADPRRDAAPAFFMRSAGGQNGELQARLGESLAAVARRVTNLPLYYLIVLREEGGMYYAAAPPGADGLAPYPLLRPLLLERSSRAETLYAGIHQSVMGQQGFRCDTRVFSSQVVRIPGWSNWFGSAAAADLLTGEGLLDSLPEAAAGRSWQPLAGELRRTPAGLTIGEGAAEHEALLSLDQPAGLLHLLLEAGAAAGWRVALTWRRDGHGRGGCRLEIESDAWSLAAVQTDGQRTFLAGGRLTLHPARPTPLQVVDDGRLVEIRLDEQLVCAVEPPLETDAGPCGVGLALSGPPGAVHLRRFEVHPRLIEPPDPLHLTPLWQPRPAAPLLEDHFQGSPADLDGRLPILGHGHEPWRKTLGGGKITAGGLVAASKERPNPGRTAYTLPWPEEDYADLEAGMRPPGGGRGEWERGRGGVIFWQDADNFLIVSVWLDDHYEGASVSSFFKVDGLEDLYDAVWSNVDGRITWGQPFRLRVAFDGCRYQAYVDGEPVLYRALTDIYPAFGRMAIRRVGLVANWEWGDDTGTRFTSFTARPADLPEGAAPHSAAEESLHG